MDYRGLLGIFSITLQLCSLVPYLIGIFRGKVRPHVFTWLIWSIIAGVAFVAQWHEGAGAGMWVTATNILACFAVIILALKHGTKHIAKSDWIALSISFMAIPVWVITNNPLWSVIIVCFIDGIAFWPTVRKAWYRPRDELMRTFFFGGAAYLLAIPALANVNAITILYPAWLGTINMLFVAMMFLRRRTLNN